MPTWSSREKRVCPRGQERPRDVRPGTGAQQGPVRCCCGLDVGIRTCVNTPTRWALLVQGPQDLGRGLRRSRGQPQASGPWHTPLCHTRPRHPTRNTPVGACSLDMGRENKMAASLLQRVFLGCLPPRVAAGQVHGYPPSIPRREAQHRGPIAIWRGCWCVQREGTPAPRHPTTPRAPQALPPTQSEAPQPPGRGPGGGGGASCAA